MSARKTAGHKGELCGTEEDIKPQRHLCQLEPCLVLHGAGFFFTSYTRLFFVFVFWIWMNLLLASKEGWGGSDIKCSVKKCFFTAAAVYINMRYGRMYRIWVTLNRTVLTSQICTRWVWWNQGGWNWTSALWEVDVRTTGPPGRSNTHKMLSCCQYVNN